MPTIDDKSVLELLDYVKVDSFSVRCYFKCQMSEKRVVSAVAFEPYEGKIKLSLWEKIFHPFRSYRRYYHTPITIYGVHSKNTIVLKAFKKVAKKFRWNEKEQKYICI